ncbi:hypothetical protein [Spirosoma montaniterrae]|uniref:Uncharacterized protein n=1 Tax=Spirosoma montaniterrae TaxID=1178516 RepID=A0A1P9WVI6_9BACT|nr:hypothetical protein [Spirosoma montaniterrae]AQG79348.1 hypothetical protein AWR27_08460 [Spirosoma montaniterrae]
MITETHLKDCEAQVREAIDELFNLIKKREHNLNDYIVLLADGSYKENYIGTVQNLSPYVIDDRMGHYRDLHRREFYVTYINQDREVYYNKLDQEKQAAFFRYCTSLEFMIYTHIWESNWFLKTLKQISNLVAGREYDWKIESEIPDFERREFITKEIRGVFEKENLKIVEVMKSYHSQIRNAFAHNAYNFSFPSGIGGKIYFNNYTGKNWELKSTTYEEWHDRFALTISLAHYLLEKIRTERTSLKDSIYEISHPSLLTGGKCRRTKIRYSVEHDSFTFVRD